MFQKKKGIFYCLTKNKTVVLSNTSINYFSFYQKYYFQLNLKKEENSVKRPRYKKLESTELIEQSASSEQRFRHFNNSKFN